MKKIQNGAALFFVAAVTVLAIIAIGGVWDVFNKDVLTKSFQSLGLLAVVSLIIIGAGNFMGNKSDQDPSLIVVPNSIFRVVRIITLGLLIVSVSILALLGILAIWEVISDKETLYKSIASIAIVAFSSFVIVITCLNREGDNVLTRNKSFSRGSWFLILFLGWLFFSFFSNVIFR